MIDIDDLLADVPEEPGRTLLTAEDILRLDAIQIAFQESNEAGECHSASFSPERTVKQDNHPFSLQHSSMS